MKALGWILYRFLWLLGGLVFLCPFPLKKFVARIGGDFWFYVVRFRRKIILHNLSRVFPRLPQESMQTFQARCENLARKNLAHYVLAGLEVLERFYWTEEVVNKKVDVVGAEHLQALMGSGRGFFAMTAHLGNWELITLVGVLLKTPLSIVTKFLRNRFFDDLWVASRQAFGLQLIEERGSGLAIARAIQRGKAVGFIMDQHTGEPHGIESKFLGLKAWSPKGLAILSQRLKCPILPAYIVRIEGGRFRVHIEAPLKFPLLESEDRKYRTESGQLTPEALRYHVRVCNEKMEGWIRNYPEQYLWLHRRFKNILNYRDPLVWQL